MSGLIVTGDDVALPVTLKKDGATFTIAPTATVKTAVVSLGRVKTLIAATTSANAAAGADWANSLIIATFSSAETLAAVEVGDAILEIQVDDGGKTTWFTAVTIEKGSIA